MPKCAAIGCENTNDRDRVTQRQLELEKTAKLTFHNFPKDPQRRKAWTDAMQLSNWQPKSGSYLCSLHFEDNFFDRTSSLKTRLKDNAIPRIPRPSKRKYPDDFSEDIDDRMTASCSMNKKKLLVDRQTSVSLDRFAEQREKIKTVDRATSVSPPRIFNPPIKEQIRASNKIAIENYKKKVKSVQDKLRNRDKQIAHMQNILKTLQEKKFMTDTEFNMLECLGESNKHLLARQLSKAKDLPVHKKYSPELRTFALTLHYYSPRAYAYVREKFNTCLPHPKTISKWYQSVNGNPGLNSEALECIRERVASSQYPLLGALMFDEMSIRRQIEYDGERYYGYVDMGNDVDSDHLPIAKDALVIMVNCINSNWKIPIAYFLVNGVSSEQKCNLVRQCLSALHDVGMRIVSLTFDGTPTNISSAKHLGCSFNDTNNLQSGFPHPTTGHEVYVFLDPSHMGKLVRNTLGDAKSIVNSENEFILWRYIEKLQETQEAEGLHLGNKLRSAHVHFRKQKMKVRLATQTLSKSVADALQICRDDLQLPDFQDCAATIEFILIFNDLFDILNSRSLKQLGLKKPLNTHNKDEIFRRLEEIEIYILGLKTAKDGISILQSRKSTGFLGFLICINSFKGLFTTVCETLRLLQYIPCYKLSQDHLELFFACIRSCGGHNNNPSARQFRAAMKKMLVHTELKAVTGNCMPLQNVSILHFTSNTRSSAIDTINNSTPRLCDSNFKTLSDVIDIHSYCPEFRSISEFSNKIISYIAGFVVKTLLQKLECERCINAIVTDEQNRSRDHSLIYKKSLGGLIYPSTDVIYVCKVSERKIRFALHESQGNVSGLKFRGSVLVHSILNEFIGNDNVFLGLEDHSVEQDAMNNHRVHLIKAIVQKYVKTRLHYIGKTFINNDSDRQKFNKIVLFKGQ